MGATCSGKDKIASYITENYEDFKMIVSTTSRPIRPKEKNGVEYYFVSREEFEKILNDDGFIEHRKYNTIVNGVKDTWYYGVEKKNISDEKTNYVAVMDYQGAKEFMEHVGRKNVILIYVQALYAERYVRNVLRGDFDLQEWNRRNKDDAEWLISAYRDAEITIDNFGYNYPKNPIPDDFTVDLVDGLDISARPTFEDVKPTIEYLVGFARKEMNK
jgi:guanylate kinase